MRYDSWIEINPSTEEIIEKTSTGYLAKQGAAGLEQKMEILRASGFGDLELRTMSGESFTGGEEPYWLWLVARKR